MSPIQRLSLFRLATVEPVPISTVVPGSTSITRVFMSVQTSIMSSVELAVSSSTPLATSSMSPTGSLSAAQLTQAPSLPTNATLFGNAPRSAKNLRIPIFAIILLSIVALILLPATIYLVRLRAGKSCKQNHQLDFERRMEVIEARAIMPKDETLSRSYSQIPLFGGEDNASEGKELAVLPRVHSINDLVNLTPINTHFDLNTPPLFNTELKKSRTLSYDVRNPRTTFAISRPYTMSSRAPRIENPTSPVSPGSPKTGRALSQYTTMQTRRPPSTQIGLPELQSELATIYQSPAVKSIWSPTDPSTSSIYFEAPNARLSALTPIPARSTERVSIPRQSLGTSRKGSITITEPLIKLLDLSISGSTRQQGLQSQFITPVYTRMKRNSISFNHLEMPTYSPVHSFVSAPLEPERVVLPPSRRPSLAELNAMSDDMSLEYPLGLERVNGEVKIERWLEGSATATLTSMAFDPNDLASRGRRLSFVERGRQGRRRSVKLSPIRDMRPSAARRGSAQQGDSGV